MIADSTATVDVRPFVPTVTNLDSP